ncbi:MFS transporter [Alkalihalobacterium alkalinitrilicum]|uniref:MFS transporter n=1 Tax=Alkalihalobacterium alkalinitrilicum TaxID=427920 RepID=UPI00115384A8|nr:MFS transporter [Alkalihalobacterium alkalinitrilicum]
MWFANFLVAASATMVLPFLSLYIKTLGDFSEAYVQQWAGYVFGLTFLVAFLVSPIWGRFGDKYGRKKILVFTSAGIGISVLLMGFVSSVTELFILRAFMGFVTGFIPTSAALISAQCKKETAGRTLGTLQTGTVSGGLCGPLLGGVLADTVGFQYTFTITGVVIIFASILVAFGIKEVVFKETNAEKKVYTRKEVVMHIIKSPILMSVMMISLVIQAANFSIQPLLALYVHELTRTENLAFLAGFAFSVTGLGNLLATRKWGDLGDRLGHGKILIILLFLSALFFIPQALVTELWQLIILRFLFGLQIGGLLPCMTAYIRHLAPLSVQGEVLGYNVSFRFLGNVVGPVMGGVVAASFGIAMVFYISGFLLVLSGVFLWIAVAREGKRKEDKETHLSA